MNPRGRWTLRFGSGLALAFWLLTVGVAHAGEPTAAEILKLHDAAHSGFKDLILDSKMVIREPGQTTGREFSFTTTMKGEDKRLVRFTAPGDFKGMGMLTEGRDTMYVYLPGFQKVRRMGIHLKNQSFAGSDMSYEDMNESTLTGFYEPKFVGVEGNNWILEVTLLPGKEAEFPKLKLWIDKGFHQATKIEFFDATGKKAKTGLRSGWKRDEGNGEHWSPTSVLMTDHRRNDHSTEIQMVKARVNTNVPDDMFSQRSLIRGN
ncbi:MAG: outer membrane lipoprotein-sorting protein [Myxococcales bacterium]|nr:outer membrane lipoprotein-sorting protein [Myxococcales bacterium]